MEVLTEKNLFSAGEDKPLLAATLLRANFRRMNNSVQENQQNVSTRSSKN